MKTSLPFKQPWGSDDEYPTRIGVILFKEGDNDDDQSQGKNDDVDPMILGQGPAITMDADLKPEQVSKAHQYQWHNELPWVKEARNTVLSQDVQALSNIRWHCTAILVMILEQAKIQDILWVEPEAPGNESLYPVWKLAQEQGQHFIRFLLHRNAPSSSSMGIHEPATLKHRNTKNDGKFKIFLSLVHKVWWEHHHYCQPPATRILQAGGHLQPVLPIHHDQAWRHEGSLALCKW